jgi:DUF1680 family protein
MNNGDAQARPSGYRAVPLASVSITSSFWTERMRTVRHKTLPYQHEMLCSTGRLDALRVDDRPEDAPTPHIFWDSDVAKWIEAASYSLVSEADPDLDAMVDEAIALLAAAQREDGYLNSYFTVARPGDRWTDLRDAHELYCAGHLIEAGVAHARATGKHSLLDVVCRYADHIDRTFGAAPGKLRGYPGHEEIELALVKLYRLTGEDRYLQLSRYFIDERGQQPFYFEQEAKDRGTVGYFGHQPPFDRRLAEPEMFREYNQSHLPVREQTRVVGHAVRAMYLFSAMADVAAETGDAGLADACETLWANLTSCQMYLTGGLGPSHVIEGFTDDYVLPNAGAYAETCAAIGLVFWGHRMALLTGRANYTDVVERALYNAVISGVSLDGHRFFYGNPLQSSGDVEREEWFDVACCPPNLARLLMSLGEYLYAVGEQELLVNLYIASQAILDVDGTAVTITQEGEQPWSGDVSISIHLEAPATFTVSLRVPDWCNSAQIRVNGAVLSVTASERGYLSVNREWRAGDQLALSMGMPVHRTYAHPQVEADAGQVALVRGPIVYCLEQLDQSLPLHRLSLPRASAVRVAPDEQLGCLNLSATGSATVADDWGCRLYRTTAAALGPVDIVAVPFYAWNNRGKSAMRVWIPEPTADQ